MQLAKEAKVAVIPGSSFGPGGEGYVRFSYAASMDNLTNAIARIEKFLKAKRA
jgi:aminotransferase